MLNPVRPWMMDTYSGLQNVGVTVQPVTYTFVYKWDVSKRTAAGRCGGTGAAECLARDETLLCCFQEVLRSVASAAARGLDELLGQDSVALG